MQTSQIRKEVMAEIIGTIRDAECAGGDGLAAAHAAYPGIPGSVVGAAWWEAQEEAEEAWWKTVERTIEGEIVRNALAKAGE